MLLPFCRLVSPSIVCTNHPVDSLTMYVQWRIEHGPVQYSNGNLYLYALVYPFISCQNLEAPNQSWSRKPVPVSLDGDRLYVAQSPSPAEVGFNLTHVEKASASREIQSLCKDLIFDFDDSAMTPEKVGWQVVSNDSSTCVRRLQTCCMLA